MKLFRYITIYPSCSISKYFYKLLKAVRIYLHNEVLKHTQTAGIYSDLVSDVVTLHSCNSKYILRFVNPFSNEFIEAAGSYSFVHVTRLRVIGALPCMHERVTYAWELIVKSCKIYVPAPPFAADVYVYNSRACQGYIKLVNSVCRVHCRLAQYCQHPS